MTILEEILANKKEEVAKKRELIPIKLLEQSIYYETDCVSFKKYLTRPDKHGIISEIKKKSPSKGDLNPYISVERVSIGYMQAGSSALSILTDEKYFGGKNDDLTMARKMLYCPILRKDFIFDEYQIIEAKSIGADAILLIAAVLSPEEVKRLAAFAKSLGLEVLLEVHNELELNRSLNEFIDCVGVNNRNLKDFAVDIQTSLNLVNQIPNQFVKVAESGINEPKDIVRLKKAGFQGFLVGQKFMETAEPHKTCEKFIKQLAQAQA